MEGSGKEVESRVTVSVCTELLREEREENVEKFWSFVECYRRENESSLQPRVEMWVDVTEIAYRHVAVRCINRCISKTSLHAKELMDAFIKSIKRQNYSYFLIARPPAHDAPKCKIVVYKITPRYATFAQRIDDYSTEASRLYAEHTFNVDVNVNSDGLPTSHLLYAETAESADEFWRFLECYSSRLGVGMPLELKQMWVDVSRYMWSRDPSKQDEEEEEEELVASCVAKSSPHAKHLLDLFVDALTPSQNLCCLIALPLHILNTPSHTCKDIVFLITPLFTDELLDHFSPQAADIYARSHPFPLPHPRLHF